MKIVNGFVAIGAMLLACVASGKDATSVAPKFAHELPNVPGKSIIAVEVTFPPGNVAAPHRHPQSGALYVYVLTGSVRSQVEGEPAKTYHAGESWFEGPGAHHIVATNPSKTKAAKILAVFVVDSNEKALVTPDQAPEAQK